MSSFPARILGPILVYALLGPAPVLADATPPASAITSLTPDTALAAEVAARLRQILPGETVHVRTANAGLVLSGPLSSAENLQRALAIAQDHAPGRVANLMTVGQMPQIVLTVQLAEMPPAVARNLSAALAMTGEGLPAGDIDLTGHAAGQASNAGLIAALEAKGVLRLLASPTLSFAAGPGSRPVAGQGCTVAEAVSDRSQGGLALDLTPTRTEDGRIAVAIRLCPQGRRGDKAAATTVTVLLRDGQTVAVENLPGASKDPDRQVAVLLLITARTGGPVPQPASPATHAPARIATDSGLILIGQTARPRTDAGLLAPQPAFPLPQLLVK